MTIPGTTIEVGLATFGMALQLGNGDPVKGIHDAVLAAYVRANASGSGLAPASAAPTVVKPSMGIFGPAQPAPPAAPSPLPPVPPAPAPELDSAGRPWDADLHARTQAKNLDGTWRIKRNSREVNQRNRAIPDADRSLLLKTLHDIYGSEEFTAKNATALMRTAQPAHMPLVRRLESLGFKWNALSIGTKLAMLEPFEGVVDGQTLRIRSRRTTGHVRAFRIEVSPAKRGAEFAEGPARVAKSVDAADLKSAAPAKGNAGSKPAPGTTLLRTREAMTLLGVSESTMFRMASQGQLTPVRFGKRCTRWSADEVRALASAVQPGDATGSAP